MATTNNKKIIIFDLDGTLTESRTPMDEEMTILFRELLERFKVAVISGGLFSRFEIQILYPIGESAYLKNLSMLPANGTSFFVFDSGWKALYEKKLSEEDKKVIRHGVAEALKELGLEEFFHERKGSVDDKDGQMTLVMMSKDTPLEEKKAWDPEGEKRKPIKELLLKKIPQFTITIGGTTSIDITPAGADKGEAVKEVLKHFSLAPTDAFFVGDAIFPGGNDYAASLVVESKKVNDPSDTKRVIQSLLTTHV